jgi:hypothetical protein
MAAVAGNDHPIDIDTLVADTDAARVVALRTCEVRWINPGRAPAAALEWFAPLQTGVEDRDDDYLVWPRLPGLSAKIRGTESFDVKARCGLVGALDLGRGGLAAPIESWEKLSFPLTAAPVWTLGDRGHGWRRVHKHRRIAVIDDPGLGDRASRAETCAAELTDFSVDGDPWWTLAIEASGGDAERAVRRAAADVFAERPPVDAFVLARATSYAAWLERREA